MMKGDVQLELCAMISGFHHILMKRAIESSMHFNQWAKWNIQVYKVEAHSMEDMYTLWDGHDGF